MDDGLEFYSACAYFWMRRGGRRGRKNVFRGGTDETEFSPVTQFRVGPNIKINCVKLEVIFKRIRKYIHNIFKMRLTRDHKRATTLAP